MAFCWLTVFIVLLLLEICTVNLISIWFAIGAFVSFFVAMFTNSIIIQMVVFILVSLVTLLITKPIVKKIKSTKVTTNLDRVIGMEGIVTEDISNLQIGEVKVDGKKWSAISKQNISKGEIVEIEKIDGVKLVVRKKKED